MKTHWVFAYGSNMDLADLSRWCQERGRPEGRIGQTRAARLPGHRLVWNYYSKARSGGAANVEPAPGAELHGVALEVCATALSAIDAKEGHPHRYFRGRRPVPVELALDQKIEAWLYVVRPEYTHPDPVLPRREYVSLIVRAAERHGLPDWYLQELRRIPTLD